MRPFLIITIILFAIACKKEKKPEEKQVQEYLHMSYKLNGATINMQPPDYDFGCGSSNSGISFHFVRNSFNLPGSDNELMISLKGRMETKTYTIPRTYSPIHLSYYDTALTEYSMEAGTFSLSKIDSINFIYKGKFEGVFINDSETDSFVLTDGDFYFQAP